MQMLQQVRQFLQALETIQDEQAALSQRKQAALKQARAAELQALAEPEVELTRRMQSLLSRRQGLLQQAGRDGLPAESITALTAAVGGDGQAELTRRVARIKERADRLRRENLVHWIVAQRAHSHYSDLLELIAHRGRKAPVYAQSASRDGGGGGAILDASA